jgi:squalene-hopene/tetraprenyl-beta-curcumene cyclase
MNTYYSVEAIRLTQDVEDRRPASEKRVDINWAETVKYIERLQNPPESGTENAGGFFYKPGESKAGTATAPDGTVVLRSYGSITYAGLLALIYANVSRDDVRVRSAFDWATRHWTLEENPGMGPRGLYFFYNIIAKSLAAYGQELVPRADGEFVNWRQALARKIVSVQRVDEEGGGGYWLNEDGSYWENNPVLVTAYSLLALETILPD